MTFRRLLRFLPLVFAASRFIKRMQEERAAAVSRSTSRQRVAAPIAGAFVGGVLVYFFDPDQGRRRRAVARDRSLALLRGTRRTVSRRGRYAAGRAEGIKHRLTREGPREPANDPTLQHKIESEVLRNYAAAQVNVNVEDGVAVLRGQLQTPDEINALVADVGKVQGIRDVRNLLHLRNTAPHTAR